MSPSPFADTPTPPYYAVIFRSQRQGEDDGYAAMAMRMSELAAQQPGYLGVESTRDADERGRGGWYRHFELRVARVERGYGGPAA